MMPSNKTLLASYTNGNYGVFLYDDGTKWREIVDSPAPIVPESLDLKITDWCDAGCAWCHEQSTTKGKEADYIDLCHKLDTLPGGIELAIGGGDPLSYSKIYDLLSFMKKRQLIANITVNGRHIPRHLQLIQKLRGEQLIHGLGVSYYKAHHEPIFANKDPNTIVHFIAGLDDPQKLINFPASKVLILGYKNYGRGLKYQQSTTLSVQIQQNLKRWSYWLHDIMLRHHTSFDNLAITQLKVQDQVSSEMWQNHYMGDDGSFTMYIDAVKQEFAKSSTSKRIAWNSLSIPRMFEQVRANKDINLI